MTEDLTSIRVDVGVSKVSDPISSWVTLSEMGTKAVLLHPFSPLVCCADEKETIRSVCWLCHMIEPRNLRRRHCCTFRT